MHTSTSSSLRFAFGILLALVALLYATGATWLVDPGGGGDATTIQGAVDLSSSGDLVLVSAGTYVEQVDVPHRLTIRSVSGAASTVIDQAGTEIFGIFNTGQALAVEGITFTGANALPPGCTGAANIGSSGPSLVVSGCVFENNFVGLAPVWQELGIVIATACEFRNNQGGAGCGSDPDHGVAAIAVDGDLIVSACVFDGNIATSGTLDAIDLSVTDSVFRNEYAGGGGLFTGPETTSNTVFLRNNLFVDSVGPLVGDRYWRPDTEYECDIENNTFARCDDMFPTEMLIASGSRLLYNSLSGGNRGLGLRNNAAGLVVFCNNSFGHSQWDYDGFDPKLPANYSEAPLFCDPDNDNFHPAINSPLAPGSSPCNHLIGAFDVGCGPVSIEATGWGQVKALYR